MDFEQLRIFVAVAESGGFTKAAESLYISHSTTSRQVSALEESLDTKLFIRSSRKVSLTAAGEALYAGAAELLGQMEELKETVKRASQQSPQTDKNKRRS